MKLIDTVDALGQVLCHDMTQIIPGVKKEAAFRKGHIVTKEDIPILLSMGKEHLYVWEKDENTLHEDEAAMILYDICKNDYMTGSEIKEGKIELKATIDGMFYINQEKLKQINALGEVIIATRHSKFPVKAGDKLSGARVIPLVIEKEKMNQVKEIAGDEPLFTLLPFQEKKLLLSLQAVKFILERSKMRLVQY